MRDHRLFAYLKSHTFLLFSNCLYSSPTASCLDCPDPHPFLRTHLWDPLGRCSKDVQIPSFSARHRLSLYYSKAQKSTPFRNVMCELVYLFVKRVSCGCCQFAYFQLLVNLKNTSVYKGPPFSTWGTVKAVWGLNTSRFSVMISCRSGGRGTSFPFM